MYKSPIDGIIADFQVKARQEQEKLVFEAVQKVGVNVDKDELIKALNYDRQQYKKGYCDGVRTFVESFLKTVREKHYLLSDKINSKDYGMFTVGIEQAVNETKIEIAGESDV